MRYSWIKLFIEVLDDPKVGMMPDWAFRRFIQFLLVAREQNKAGLLGPVAQLAWRLRSSEDDMLKSLRTLSEIGIVAETPDGWLVTNFEKRQAAQSPTERSQEFRKRGRNETETKRFKECNEAGHEDSSSASSSISPSTSSRGGGMGEGCYAIYEKNFGALTSMIGDELADLEQQFGNVWLSEAMAEAVRNEARSLSYVAAILKRWRRDGFKTPRSKETTGRKTEVDQQEHNKAVIKELAHGI